MKSRTIVIATVGILLSAPAGADEGMWLPRQTPHLAETLKGKGLELDPKTLADLQKAPMNAIASLGGCSAAFLSPQGLVATNHHCVYGSIQYNSKPGQDYLTDGFLAATLSDELPAAPGSRIYVIEDLRDVTQEMSTGEAKERSGRLQAARSAYMQGMLAFAESGGRALYPDANGSLRFTYGKVTGKAVDGQNWTPFTTAEGLAAKQTGKGEFNAPQKAISLIKAKDYGRWVSPELGTLPVDYLSTVDITNGNSGSSTLNARGEFVDLAFDGTLEGVVSDWAYDPTINRTIHVDSRLMLWTMDKVDGAQRLLQKWA